MNNNYSLAIEAAIEAGNAINSIYGSNAYEVTTKADNSPVTKADKKSSEIIGQYLKKTGIPVIDEEHGWPEYSVRRQWNKLWLVDPMDGTKEFLSGNGEFTVNIALIEDGKPVFGVIYAPVKGDLYWGGGALGSFKIEGIRTWSGIEEIQSASSKLCLQADSSSVIHVAASRSHLDKQTEQFIKELEIKHKNIETLSRGSSLKLCMIAEGSVDVYPRFSRTMEWDTAAGHAIVKGTSGVLVLAGTDTEISYNKEDLANPSFVAMSGNYRF